MGRESSALTSQEPPFVTADLDSLTITKRTHAEEVQYIVLKRFFFFQIFIVVIVFLCYLWPFHFVHFVVVVVGLSLPRCFSPFTVIVLLYSAKITYLLCYPVSLSPLH